MTPNIHSPNPTGVLYECDDEIQEKEPVQEQEPPEIKLVWSAIIVLVYFHLVAAYGVYLLFTSAKKSVIDWSRDHRVHHKFTETNADPHNAKRGFFFSHFGWLMCKKHPEVIRQGKKIDISDLYADPILRFQHKYYLFLVLIITFALPVSIPVFFWNETWLNSFCLNMLRFLYTVHVSALVNSVAHMWGHRPYDKHINPTDTLTVSLLTNGEGWHNYHHTFPWDYKAAELGNYSGNLSTWFIDLAAKINWAYDLKSVSQDVVKKRVARTGDGSHALWGWGDKDQPKEAYEATTIIYKKK